jgi:hypothetical protein
MTNLNQELKQYLVSRLRHSKRHIRESPLNAKVVKQLIAVGGGKLRVERITISIKGRDRDNQRLALRILLFMTLVGSAVIWHEYGLPLSQFSEIVRSVMIRDTLQEQHSVDHGVSPDVRRVQP